MGWVVLAIAVAAVVVIAGWLWSRRSHTDALSTPAGRRATDAEAASTTEPDALPLIPPPSGAGVPMVPIVPTLGTDDERGGPLPDEPGGEPVAGDDERAEN